MRRKVTILGYYFALTIILIHAPDTGCTETRSCTGTQFQCGDGTCIKSKLKCDGDPDCEDGSDESPQTCRPSIPACPANKFQCGDGSCLKMSLVCDLDPDCLDESDESPEACDDKLNGVTCSTTDFQCGDGSCVKGKFFCDGDPDCPDGSDEDPIRCQSLLPTADTPDNFGPDNSEPLDTDLPSTEDPGLVHIEKSFQDTINETLSLLAGGDINIPLDPLHRDLILVIGNTGAGKSTMAKFLTSSGGQSMEAYTSGGRILIRDTDGLISVNSTIVSKTIYPNRLIDPVTHSAFYDMPGFMDTRAPSIEIANAFFMKKVADHARRVKLLFVVNYSSLRSGENRLALKLMLEQATDFILNTPKFTRAIGIIATKVEQQQSLSSRSTIQTDEQIINSIARFLERAKFDLETIIQDPTKFIQASNIIDAMTQKNPQGQYTNIGIFKQPKRIGPLTLDPEVQSVIPRLNQLVFSTMEFVQKSNFDFGISVSSSSRLLVTNLGEKISAQISLIIKTNLGGAIQQNFVTSINRSEPTGHLKLLQTFLKEFQTLQNLTRKLEQCKNTKDFLNHLIPTIQNMSIGGYPPYTPILQELRMKEGNLDFLELIAGDPSLIPARPMEWLINLENSLQLTANVIYELAQKLDLEIGNILSGVAGQLKISYGKMVDRIRANSTETGVVESLKKNLTHDLGLIFNMTERLQTIHSFSGFWNQLDKSMDDLKVPLEMAQNATSPLFNSIQNNGWIDLNLNSLLGRGSPFRRHVWLISFHDVLSFMQQQMAAVAQLLNDQIYAATARDFDSKMVQLQTEQKELMTAVENREKETRARHAQELEILQSRMRDLREEEGKLKIQQDEDKREWMEEERRKEHERDKMEMQRQIQRQDEEQRDRDAAHNRRIQQMILQQQDRDAVHQSEKELFRQQNEEQEKLQEAFRRLQANRDQIRREEEQANRLQEQQRMNSYNQLLDRQLAYANRPAKTSVCVIC